MNEVERAIEVLKYYKPKENELIHERDATHKDVEFFDLAISALEKQKIIENLHITLEEVIARNLIAWETSRDKREGYLPEVYLTNQILFKQFTGLEPTIPNLKEVGRLD